MRYFPKFDRHLVILLIAQALAGSAMPVLFLITGLTGPKLAPTLRLSTLPMSLVVIGVALFSPVASWTMSRVGRKKGHLLGLCFSLTGVLTAAVGLWSRNFPAYCAASGIFGAGAAFNNQIRFTAAEAVPEQKSLVHSWVLMFSLFAAFLGPAIAENGRDLLSFGDYTGSLAVLFALLLVLVALLAALPEKKSAPGVAAQVPGISYSLVLRQEKFWLAALAGIASYATMTLLMSATPLQMHEMEHFSVAETTRTIQSHLAAMFLPSLFSGILISWLGIRRLIGLGLLLFLVCIGIAYSSTHFHHYWWALVLLGVGWNFLFLAGSTWVSESYSGPERFAAQGANDILVFGMQSVASLSAGWLLFEFGWKRLVLVPIPFLIALLVLVFLRDPLRSRAAPS